MIWGRIIWGIWWTWDWRLTSSLICWLLYAGYLVLRRAVEEPTERARLSAVMSILSFSVVPFVFFSIKWFRTQHPQPVLYGEGKMDSAYRYMLYMNWVPLLMVAVMLVAFIGIAAMAIQQRYIWRREDPPRGTQALKQRSGRAAGMPV